MEKNTFQIKEKYISEPEKKENISIINIFLIKSNPIIIIMIVDPKINISYLNFI